MANSESSITIASQSGEFLDIGIENLRAETQDAMTSAQPHTVTNIPITLNMPMTLAFPDGSHLVKVKDGVLSSASAVPDNSFVVNPNNTEEAAYLLLTRLPIKFLRSDAGCGAIVRLYDRMNGRLTEDKDLEPLEHAPDHLHCPICTPDDEVVIMGLDGAIGILSHVQVERIKELSRRSGTFPTNVVDEALEIMERKLDAGKYWPKLPIAPGL